MRSKHVTHSFIFSEISCRCCRTNSFCVISRLYLPPNKMNTLWYVRTCVLPLSASSPPMKIETPLEKGNRGSIYSHTLSIYLIPLQDLDPRSWSRSRRSTDQAKGQTERWVREGGEHHFDGVARVDMADGAASTLSNGEWVDLTSCAMSVAQGEVFKVLAI
jgi:hypothetical protein